MLNQAALLFIQLLFMWKASAGTVEMFVCAVCAHLHLLAFLLTACFLHS
ncbi:unnamed protein product [Tetraodon nigroviridis]|uniref:(spotted green pufferfish) hypothetical protein n=1 Tax=Tetraodon nigroviridis TaxID=99883 RepID=Q4T5Z1_TETNG|nr:unnamed protein product [Tetraodon nigroviridis]CAF91691.1 unnamed protein product [Tetraodon nigroviridis]